jgi:transcriptional regulator of acetoin/glycerol metabolism
VLDLPERCGGGAGNAAGLAERAERSLIRAVLDAHNGHRAAAAIELGISRSTLYRRLRAYGLDDRGG